MKKEQLKIEAGLAKCKSAKLELQLKILEKEEDIERIKEHIKLQDEREAELLQEQQEINNN